MTRLNLCEVKVKYDKTLDNGLIGKISETYLVDAFTMSEAENRMIDYISPFITGEFEIISIKKYRISEVHNIAEGVWFRCKLSLISIDEKSGVEKKSTFNMLVRADNIDSASEIVKEVMKCTVSDWESNDIVSTNIVDVILCEKSQDSKIETNE